MPIDVTSLRESHRLPRLKRASRDVRRSAKRARGRAGLLRGLLVGLVLTLAASFVTLSYLYTSYSKIVDERLTTGYLTSRAGIYAAPRVLRTGQSLTKDRLVEMLRRAGYVEHEASDVWSGRFNIEANSVVIHPRRLPGASVAPAFAEVRVAFNAKQRIAEITADKAALASYALEPEALTNDTSMKTGTRAALSYADIPTVLVQAILAIEDRRFFEHRGIDSLGLARALWSWVGAGHETRRQGGSTITQQLVKNTYLTPERTLRRKFNEAMLASALERRLSKADIFALYCNEIYLGQRGSIAVRGVAQAARLYFGKELKDLSLAEAATIAGMIQSPARYKPDRHPEKSKQRRNTVLAAMLHEGFISSEQAAAALHEPVCVAPLSADAESATAPYFIDYVNRVVASQVETGEADEHNLRVHTTIDLELQQLAETAIQKQLAQLDKIYQGRQPPQAALVALDPHTGHVLAMVGGRGYGDSQLNRATDARRQPGSIFKPFIYAAALESGVSPVATFADAPRDFLYDYRAKYHPANYGNAYSMRDVTMRTGLVRSLNVVTVDIAMRTGLARVARVAETFGLPKPAPYPALALGTTEVTPLEIAAAYAALANGGQRVKPAVMTTETNSMAAVEQAAATAQPQVIRPSTAYMITDMLTAVINQGTARAARGALKGTAYAGKTGTSRDGWFAGYTPHLVCVVWIGFDDNSQLGLTGAESALPAWVEFMKGAVELRPELGSAAFMRPAGIMTTEIDPETGMLASPACPQRERIAVTPTLAPGYECTLHNMTDDALPDASEADFYPAPNVAVVPTASVSDATPPTGPTNARITNIKSPPPSLPASMNANTALPGNTMMETDRHSGRPKLSNNLRVVTDEQ